MIPDHLRYTNEHEWAFLTEEGNVRFGITHHAQDALGDIVFVTLPDVGAALEVGDSCGEIESTKSVSEIFAPISGEVVARNDAVETSPESINADPYGNGWLVEIAPSNSEQLNALLDAAAYATLTN
ncbi:MAG: glycine cleavage system protein GcvH [Actinobacteria bacterium]|nr:glycine cleavage system protein GcvH [Actinomycetota bacterium]